MRQIIHPGPVAPERTTAVTGSSVPLRFALAPGRAVDEAIAEGFEASGCTGGFVTFQGGRCKPFKYVIPAVSPDASHAAWYSGTFEPEGPVDIRRACAIVGARDGKPFIHCHGVWDTADGLRMGHMLPPDTIVAEPIEVTGIGLRDTTFQSMADAETNFMLFEPVRVRGGEAGPGAGRTLLVRVRPNEDISLAIEAICARHGIQTADVFGIGSLNGVRFTDGGRVEAHATEVLIRRGRLESTGGQPRAHLGIEVVDTEGAIFAGELVRGDNPVCVTFELVIEAREEGT